MARIENPYVGDLHRGLELAHLLCTAVQQHAFVTILKGGRSYFLSVGGWAGDNPPLDSRAPYASGAKALELLWKGAPRPGQLLCTPTDLSLSLGWKGGVRNTDYIVGVSKWAEEHDLLLALIVLYGLQQEVRLHHVGFRYASIDAYFAASKLLGAGVDVPAKDHLRRYHRVESSLTPNGEYWQEIQFFPQGPHTRAVHWDIATSDPIGLLMHVANAFGTQPSFFADAGKYDPVGVVWIEGGDGKIMGLMTRDRWSDPATWQ